jgi:hypothetical protein
VEKNTQKETLNSVFLTEYYSGDQIKNTEMGRVCSTAQMGDRKDACGVLVASCCECGDEPSGFIKCREFLE